MLQKDIEAHGRIVSSVVKLGEKLATQNDDQQKGNEEQRQQQQQQHSALRVASSLERRWHLLFLRALEWQCHFETLASRTCNKVMYLKHFFTFPTRNIHKLSVFKSVHYVSCSYLDILSF